MAQKNSQESCNLSGGKELLIFVDLGEPPISYRELDANRNIEETIRRIVHIRKLCKFPKILNLIFPEKSKEYIIFGTSYEKVSLSQMYGIYV